MMRLHYSPTIATLWAISGAGTIVVTWHEAISSAIQLCYLALTALGGGAILLYQKKLSVDREDRDAHRSQDIADELSRKAESDDLAAEFTKTTLQEVLKRLDAVIKQRDQLMHRNDQLSDQLLQMSERIDKARCMFPTADGTARCSGLEAPPCME